MIPVVLVILAMILLISYDTRVRDRDPHND